MALDEPSPVTESTEELRLATTMTGGVSLAIWMAGVAREINLIAQASQWRRAGSAFPSGGGTLTQESAACLKLYAELIDLLDTVVDVDVLSGTSAGGINAAVLASSRATGSDLGRLRDFWLDSGALIGLLRDPTDKTTPSLLYGDERMFAALAEQIPQLEPGPFRPATPPSTTVYITTTLLTGETGRFTDSFGTLVQDVDRRGLFTFTETDLAKADTVPALALAARSSASFPVAFEPSFIPFTDATVKKGDVPARPAMSHFTNITRPHWVADGGLLDNRPIDVLLQRIFDRPASQPVRRVLLFVVPSSGPAPDLAQQAPPDGVDDPLGLVDGLLKDLAAITNQSIATDLRAIRAHQDRMEARTDTRLRLAELAAKLPAGSRLLTTSLLTDYRTREVARQAHALTNALLRQLSTWPPASSRSIESIPKNWEDDLTGDVETVCRRWITESILKHWPQPSDLSLLPEGAADLARYGQPACDLVKGCAIAVALVAYQLAKSDADVTVLANLIDGIFTAFPSPEPSRREADGNHTEDDEDIRAFRRKNIGELVHEVCTDPAVRQDSLRFAADRLVQKYLEQSAVKEEAWDRLGEVFVNGYPTLRRLADDTLQRLAAGAQTDSLDHRDYGAASQLNTYLEYLGPAAADNPGIVARKLFDLAVAQRAMLPVEPDIEQSLELVQVSADTRSLLAPDFQTAQHKLTGVQFHHFGAFYKRSWRANDWMWGRLDGAGWLVHVLLDPRRVQRIVQAHAAEGEPGSNGSEKARWFLDRLKKLGAPELPAPGYRPFAGGGPDQHLTEKMLLDELGFLDDPAKPVPPSIPLTSLWLARTWQQRVLDEELDGLAREVIDPPGKQRDWSPASSLTWAEKVLAAGPGAAKYALLNQDPVAKETFLSDKGSPLMAHTITKAAATASAAAGSARRVPGVLKPPLMTLRTLALGGYRLVWLTNGIARRTIWAGVILLVLGATAAMQSASLFGVTGMIAAAIGGYSIVLGTWQCSSRLLFALLSFSLVGLVFALTNGYVRGRLFGTQEKPGLVGAHVYWLGEQWWHPLIVVGAIALTVTLIAAARPARK